MSTYTIEEFYGTCTTRKERIAKIDIIIDALLDASVIGAGSSCVVEESLDDGQTKIKSIYRSMSEVETAIHRFTRLQTKYANMCKGRSTRLRDRDSFNINKC